ncbi:uncharacterized protein PAC_05794 [Phialocephala subalpina]|uniref:Xylanolytic transcriptional activator regulatory domain-containing protein n=1 Tax=Phialocephala subalpina TaxID=576137 RepID=A0A1L7WT30_9HELO|nr:uncharacterized protein PAC_05794 [Phialocephala subalpina]
MYHRLSASEHHACVPRLPMQSTPCSRLGISIQMAIRDAEVWPASIVEEKRPTNRRILQLEEENRRLRERTRRLEQRASQENRPKVQQTSETLLSRSPIEQDNQDDWSSDHGQGIEKQISNVPENFSGNLSGLAEHTVTSIVVCPAAESPETSQSSYHGPTSALFDENLRPREYDSGEDRISSKNTEWVRCMLVAETAKQRQLEAINLASNSLNFDGLSPELGMQLLSLYWSRQLHAGLIVYRPAFMRDMACEGPYFSKILLNAMYYSVSKHSPNTSIRQNAADKATAGWSFRQRFTELLRDEYDKSKITTVQALLIMASSMFTRCDERSASWLYAGNAFNMIIDMGLHVISSSSQKMAEESEIRRRVFWSAYMIDKIQCLYQGRHPCLRISDTNVPLMFVDDYEEFEKFDHVSFCDPSKFGTLPSYSISMLQKLCELSIIMERIHSKVYAVSYSTQKSDDLCNESLALDHELKSWRKDLPPHLDFIASKNKTNPLPYNLSMLAVYNVLVILVHQLLLSNSRSLSTPRNVAHEALITCMTAANEITHILQVYEKLYDPSSATFSLSYATYISAKIHVHILAQHGDQFGTTKSLQICLKALDRHQRIYSAARRAKAIAETLMTRMGVRVGDHGRSSMQIPLSGSAYESATSPKNSRAGILHPANPAGYGSNSITSSAPLVSIPNLDFPDFDANNVMENFRSVPGIAEGWLNAPQYMMFDDLYEVSQQDFMEYGL